MQPGNGAAVIAGGCHFLMPTASLATHAQNLVLGMGRCKIRAR
jgi:hypothetical protein